MLDLKKWMTKVSRNIPMQKFGTSATSFTAAMPSNATYNSQYMSYALDYLNTNIANYGNGIHSMSSNGGPQYGIVLYKLNASYYGGLVLSYQKDADLVYFKKDNAGYHVFVMKPSIVGGGTA